MNRFELFLEQQEKARKEGDGAKHAEITLRAIEEFHHKYSGNKYKNIYFYTNKNIVYFIGIIKVNNNDEMFEGKIRKEGDNIKTTARLKSTNHYSSVTVIETCIKIDVYNWFSQQVAEAV